MAGNLNIGTLNNGSGIVQGQTLPIDSGSTSMGGRMFIYQDGSGVKWVVHEFKDDGMLYLPSSKTCDIFMIGGGGSGGGSYGNNDTGEGGGGAGGALWRQAFTLTSGGYDILIGHGGYANTKGAQDSTNHKATMTNGGDTVAFGVYARGGGHGGASDNYNRAATGGCGGGGGARNSNGGWNDGRPSTQDSFTGWTAYGNSGGNSLNGNYSGGGGGGIGGPGGAQSGGTNSSTSQAGAGGTGRDFSSYFGISVGHFGWFGGGGGGGTYRHGTNTMYQAPGSGGGYGGGGNGVCAREGSQTEPNVYAANRINGMNGTGGGGGGAVEDHENVEVGGAQHGAGGSGVVLVRYAL